jgi:addiction module HigA family antidote
VILTFATLTPSGVFFSSGSEGSTQSNAWSFGGCSSWTKRVLFVILPVSALGSKPSGVAARVSTAFASTIDSAFASYGDREMRTKSRSSTTTKRARETPPVHPGEILAEDFMAPLGLTANRLALDLRIPPNRLSEIIRGRRSITADTALRLGRYFKTSPEMWLGLQADYELRKARVEVGKRIEREVLPAAG